MTPSGILTVVWDGIPTPPQVGGARLVYVGVLKVQPDPGAS